MKEIFFKYNVIKVLRIIVIIVIMLLLVAFLFLKMWIPLGGNLSSNDKKDYANWASNFNNGKFYNENKTQVIYENYNEHDFVSNKDTIPIDKIPIAPPTLLEDPSLDVLNITWLGHSSLLIQMHSMNILIDPIFSDVPSPISFIGTNRFSELPVDISDLPNIDLVIISHDHYDHLDYQTIKGIDSKVDKYLVPLGVENHLERWGVKGNKIITLAWWEEINTNGLLIGCTPARHESGRSLFDKNNTLWASWVFIDEYHKIFYSGDTGFDEHFEKIGNKYEEFDLALVDSGQYDTRWKTIHMTPEEAINASIALKSKTVMPIHWGTFKLARHPWDDPIERFILKAEKEKIKYITPKIGETIVYQENIQTEKWWRNIR